MKAKTGRCEGRKPFGANPKLPHEAAALGVMFACRDEGKNSKEIAAYLNERRIPTRSGEPWRDTTIAKILRRHKQEEVLVSQ